MNVKQQEEQRCNFAVLETKLEQLKPDPLISIDDFIPKMLVSSASNSENARRKPTEMTDFFPETTDVCMALTYSVHKVGLHVFPPNINPSNFDYAWGNFRSSSDVNA